MLIPRCHRRQGAPETLSIGQRRASANVVRQFSSARRWHQATNGLSSPFNAHHAMISYQSLCFIRVLFPFVENIYCVQHSSKFAMSCTPFERQYIITHFQHCHTANSYNSSMCRVTTMTVTDPRIQFDDSSIPLQLFNTTASSLGGALPLATLINTQTPKIHCISILIHKPNSSIQSGSTRVNK